MLIIQYKSIYLCYNNLITKHAAPYIYIHSTLPSGMLSYSLPISLSVAFNFYLNTDLILKHALFVFMFMQLYGLHNTLLTTMFIYVGATLLPLCIYVFTCNCMLRTSNECCHG